MTVVGIDFGTTTCSVAWWNGTVKEKPILQALDREEKGIAAAIMPTVVKLPNGRELRNFKPVTDQMGRGEISLVRLETPKEKIKFKYDPMGQCELALNNDVEYRLIIERNPVDKGGELYPEEELEKALDILFADLYQRVGKRAKADQIVVGLPLSYSDVGRKRIIQSLLNSKWANRRARFYFSQNPWLLP